MKKIRPRHLIVNEHLFPFFRPQKVEKVWGSEQIICTQPHACKIMTVRPGFEVSLHIHREKAETFVLIEGELIVEVIKQDGSKYKVELVEKYSSITLPPMTPHTFYCPDNQIFDTIFIEASTADTSTDNYRIYPSGKRTKNTNNR